MVVPRLWIKVKRETIVWECGAQRQRIRVKAIPSKFHEIHTSKHLSNMQTNPLT